MSDLTFIEKNKLERLFDMSSGYVMTFSNRTFQDFIIECCSVDIYDKKYTEDGDSKAKILRAFWKLEDNQMVSLLIEKLLEYWRFQNDENILGLDTKKQSLYEECLRIVARLRQNISDQDMNFIKSKSDDKNFLMLVDSIQQNIRENKPELALDRLHTFLTKYLRDACKKNNIIYLEDNPLHSLMGMYIKVLIANKVVEAKWVNWCLSQISQYWTDSIKLGITRVLHMITKYLITMKVILLSARLSV